MKFFNKVSELTIYKLVYELFETKIYKQGDIIFNDCSYLDKYSGVNYIKMIKIKKRNFMGQLLANWQFKETVY